LARTVRKLTDGAMVDVVFEHIGGISSARR